MPATGVEGEEITVTATPNKGFKLSAIDVEDADGTGVSDTETGNSSKFTMPAKAVSVTATFVALATPTVTTTGVTGGTLSFSPALVDGKATEGTKYTVTFTPTTENYVIGTMTTTTNATGWAAVANTKNKWTFTAGTSDITLAGTPAFDASSVEYDQTVKQGSATAGTENYSVQGQVGNTVKIKIEPKGGFTVSSVSYGGAVTPEDGVYTITVVADQTFNVTYAAKTAGKVVVTAGDGGTASAPTTVYQGDKITVTTKPETGKVVDKITAVDEDGDAVTVADGAFTLGAKAVFVTVTFKDAPKGEESKPNDTPSNPAPSNPAPSTPSTSKPTESKPTESKPTETKAPEASVSAIPAADKPVEVSVEAAGVIGDVSKVFTAEEIKAAGDAKVDVKVVVSAAPDTDAVKTAKETITNAVKGEYDVSDFVEIDLVAILGSAKKNITSSDGNVTITLPVPEALRGKTVALAREHDGKVAVLEDLDNDPNTITVKSKLFSTYAFVTKKAGSASEPNSATGVALGITPVLLAGAAVTVAVLKRRGNK
ncbi:MAG: hypothetical protein NC299_07585 [Lachnospiraceae bacterium]|nr:hypothetical protein [Ruminococcus sp.]MCM1275215.1 hypothetical protein [Lachnospiraceae bacterium]